MPLREDIEKEVLENIEQGASHDDLISNLIFAGYTYKDITSVINELVSKGKVSESFAKRQHYHRDVDAPYTRIEDALPPEPVKVSSLSRFWIKYHKTIVIIAISVMAVIVVAVAGLWWYGNRASVVLSRTLASVSRASSFEYTAVARVNAQNTPSLTLFSSPYTVTVKGNVGLSPLHYAADIFITNDATSWRTYGIVTGNGALFVKLGQEGSDVIPASIAGQAIEKWVRVDMAGDVAKLSGWGPVGVFSTFAHTIAVSDDDVAVLRALIKDVPFVNVVRTKSDGGSAITAQWDGKFSDQAIVALNALLGSATPIDSAWLDKSVWEFHITGGSLSSIHIRNDDVTNTSGDVTAITITFNSFNRPVDIAVPGAYIGLDAMLQRISEQ